jgi:hypothetical protein
MSHALVIAGRELAEKRFVFLAAAAFALIAAVMPLVPGVHGSGPDAIVLAAMILATAFALGLAAILGSTIVGRDIAAGRMSFYFARPVGGAAIWFGKLAAAAALVVVSFFIAVAPALIAGPMTVRPIWAGSLWQLAAAIGAAATVLFFGAHALGTMIRSRSALLVLDFIAAALVVELAWTIARPLILSQAVKAIAALGGWYAAALLVAAVGAGAWQLIDGRSDRRRSHRAFSTFFWSALAVALVAAALFLGWIFSATPADLSDGIFVVQPPSGDAAILGGNVRHRLNYRPLFLDSTRIPGTVWATFSQDGRRAVMLQVTSPSSQAAEVVVRDAANGWRATQTQLGFRQTQLGFRHWVGPITATDDATRIAVADRSNITVYDVASSRALGSFNIGAAMMFFVTPNLIRVYSIDQQTLRAFEFDVAARALHKTGEAPMEMQTWHWIVRASADGTRALVGNRGGSVMLCDGRTLQPIAPADEDARFLQDGRLVKVPKHFAGEVAPGKGLIVTRSSTQLVDLDTGKELARAEGLQPVMITLRHLWLIGGAVTLSPDPRPIVLNPNGFYKNKEGVLVRWNPLTRTAATPVGRSRTGS